MNTVWKRQKTVNVMWWLKVEEMNARLHLLGLFYSRPLIFLSSLTKSLRLFTWDLVRKENIILNISMKNVKFLGKWNHERWQIEANVNVAPKTGEKTWPLTEAQPNANYGRRQTFNYSLTSRNNIGPKCV